MSTPRNDPCPCGSGKKFKKCCGAVAASPIEVDPVIARANAVKRADIGLHEVLMRYMRRHVDKVWIREAFDDYMAQVDKGHEDEEMALAVPWTQFHCPANENGDTVATLLMRDTRIRLTDEQFAVLHAQTQTWLSIWEVTDVQPGVGILLTDRLTGTTQFVHEVKASHVVEVHLAMLARVVRVGDVAFLAGLHPHPLTPRFAEQAVTTMRKYFRVKTRPVKMAKLREPGAQLDMIDEWRMLATAQRVPPKMTNTDGDPLSLITDRYDFASLRRSAVLQALRSLTGANEPFVDENGTEITITRSGADPTSQMNETVIARIVVEKTQLLVETNSVRRAEQIKGALDVALSGLARYRRREQADMQEMLAGAREERVSGIAPPLPESTPEMDEMMRQFREQYMQRWLDDAIPALGGLTPRQAAADPKHHVALQALLREVEYHENQLPAAQRCDMLALRTQLGM